MKRLSLIVNRKDTSDRFHITTDEPTRDAALKEVLRQLAEQGKSIDDWAIAL